MNKHIPYRIKLGTIALAVLATGLAFLAVWAAEYRTPDSAFHSAPGVYLVETPEAREQRVDLIFPHSGDHLPSKVHYTEHLAWLNANDGARDADRHSNAWTNSYAVGYWLSGQPEDLPDLLTELKGVFDPLTLPDSFALEERDIVLREYDFRVAENLMAQAGEAMNAFLYEGNSIAQSVIGTPNQIKAFTYDAAKELHARTHIPENAVLIVTGDVSSRQLRRALTEADWPELPPVADVLQPPAFELAATTIEELNYLNDTAAPRMVWRRVVRLPEPVQFDLLEAQTALLSDILIANLPGGLGGPLRFDAAIARSFDIAIWPIDEDNIEIFFEAAPDANVSLTQLQAAFEATFADIAETGIPETTYDRVLSRFDGFWPDWSDDEETAEWMADYVMDRVSILRQPLAKRSLRRLEDDLSLRATNNLLQHLNGDGRTAIAFIGPEDRFE